jgi:hypothetical protein
LLAWRCRAHKKQGVADGILLLVDSSESNRRQLLAGAFSFGSSLLLGQQASFVPTPPALAVSCTATLHCMQEASEDTCAGAVLMLEAFSSPAGGSRGHSGRCDWKPKAAGCPRPPQGIAPNTPNPRSSHEANLTALNLMQIGKVYIPTLSCTNETQACWDDSKDRWFDYPRDVSSGYTLTPSGVRIKDLAPRTGDPQALRPQIAVCRPPTMCDWACVSVCVYL